MNTAILSLLHALAEREAVSPGVTHDRVVPASKVADLVNRYLREHARRERAADVVCDVRVSLTPEAFRHLLVEAYRAGYHGAHTAARLRGALRDATRVREGTPREALAEGLLECERAIRTLRSVHTTALADPSIDARVSDLHAELRRLAEELAPGVALEADWSTCPRCNGTGRVAAGGCERCSGRGIVEDAP